MSEELTSAHQTIQSPRNRHFLAALIGLGVVGFVIELFFYAAHSENRFYWVIFWLLLLGNPFCFRRPLGNDIGFRKITHQNRIKNRQSFSVRYT